MKAGTDVAVVGAGIVGLATADALARQGRTVTVYERAAPGAAQSGGDSRIFRHSHDDPRLIARARDALAGWRAWEARFGIELLATDGVLALGPPAEERFARLRDGGVRVRMVGPDEAAVRLPLLAGLEPALPALLDEDGGVIRTTAAIAALVEALGDALVTEEVLAVRPTRHGTVEVRAAGRTAEHERVIVCAGRDTAGLAAGVGLELPVRQSVHVRTTFALRAGAPARLACLLDGSGAFGEPSAYADPLPGNARYAVGLADVPARADGRLATPGELAAMVERTRAYVAQALPGLVPEPAGARHCWVTELPWSHDALAAWRLDGLTFLAGNNLFKHAPALGEALARDDDGLHPDARLGAG